VQRLHTATLNPSHSKCVEEPLMATKLTKKCKRAIEPVFGLSVLGYCRNMEGSFENYTLYRYKGLILK